MRREANWLQRRSFIKRLAAVILVTAGTSSIASAAVAAELHMGIFLPMSGKNADIGGQMKAGYEVAIARINASGAKVAGEPLTITPHWYDDESKPDVSLGAVNRAISVDKIDVATGFLVSDIFIRVMEEFNKRNIPVVACCAGSMAVGDAIAKKNLKYAFQLSPTSKDIVNSTVAATFHYLTPKKVAIIEENSIPGREHGQVVRAWMEANASDAEIVSEDYVEPGTIEFTAQLAKIRQNGADVIIGELLGASAVSFYQQWHDLKIKAPVANHGATVSSKAFITENSEQVEKGIINVRWWPAKYSNVSEEMISSYKTKVGTDPTNFSVQAFDTALVLAGAAETAGEISGPKIKDALGTGTFETAWGTRKFTALADGHRMPITTVVIQVQDGKMVPIFPLSVAEQLGSRFKK